MAIRKIFAASLAAILALLLLTATAQAAEWWIERMSGYVQIHNGDHWVRLDQDRELKVGDSIWTGRNGRILLRNDQGSVLLEPGSLVKIPTQLLPGNFSVLFQTHGKVSAEVDKRRKRHFSIQTPYLAVVVKGTQFDVEIEKKQTRVSVSEGLVGVVDIATGQTVDVAAGSEIAAATSVGRTSLGQSVATSAPGHSGSVPGQSGSAPGRSGSAPGRTGGNPGHGGGNPGKGGGHGR